MPVEIGISHRSGQPFTATEVTTLTQTLGDGTKITRTAEDRIARDSEGRFYKEQHLPWTRDTRNPLYYVHIYDPSSKERIHLDPQKRLAMHGPAEQVYMRDYKPNDDLAMRATRTGETIKTEKLGTQDIAGVNCWGRSMTHFVPRGALGTDQPIAIVDEVWYWCGLGRDGGLCNSYRRAHKPMRNVEHLE